MSAPEFAARYFESRGITEHPRIAQVFKPGRGWADHTSQLATVEAIRALDATGVTEVALIADGRVADFAIEELREQVGLGQWRHRPDLAPWVAR